MAKALWGLPVPSTALLDDGPTFEMRLRREIALRMSYESDEGAEVVVLIFEGVEAFKVTHYRARGDWMLGACDRLVDQGKTSWLDGLDELTANLDQHGEDSAGLAHLMNSEPTEEGNDGCDNFEVGSGHSGHGI